MTTESVVRQELMPKGGIESYNEFRQQLVRMQDENKRTVFDYESPMGNRDARSYIYKLRQTKSAVDKVRQQEKAISLEYGRRVDAEAKQIVLEIEGMIEVHAKPLEIIEERERQRVQTIRDQIEWMFAASFARDESGFALDSASLQTLLEKVKNVTVGESFGEFALEAAQVKDAAVSSIEKNLVLAIKNEAEAAELAYLRKDSEERERRDREELLRREGEERAKKEIEVKAQQERDRAEIKAKADRETATKRELELKLKVEHAEREKIEAQQRADNAVKETEARLKREAEKKAKIEAEAIARREADTKHKAKINTAAATALFKNGISDNNARLVVTLIAQGKIPHVKIQY